MLAGEEGTKWRPVRFWEKTVSLWEGEFRRCISAVISTGRFGICTWPPSFFTPDLLIASCLQVGPLRGHSAFSPDVLLLFVAHVFWSRVLQFRRAVLEEAQQNVCAYVSARVCASVCVRWGTWVACLEPQWNGQPLIAHFPAIPDCFQ